MYGGSSGPETVLLGAKGEESVEKGWRAEEAGSACMWVLHTVSAPLRGVRVRRARCAPEPWDLHGGGGGLPEIQARLWRRARQRLPAP